MFHAGKAIVIQGGSLKEGSPRYAKLCVRSELGQQELEIVFAKCNIRIHIADDVKVLMEDSIQACIETLDLGREVPLSMLWHSHQFHPWVIKQILFIDVLGMVGRTIAYDHPSFRKHRLRDDRLYCFFNKRLLVSGRGDQNIFQS